MALQTTVMLTRHQDTDSQQYQDKTPVTPHSQHLCYTFMGNVQKFTSTIYVTMLQYPNSGIKFQKKSATQLHHETIHATLWVSSPTPEAQPDQLITIATQIH